MDLLKFMKIALLLTLSETFAAVEWSVRLRGGTTPLEGRVEVLLGREWSVIGSEGWDVNDASVVCRQLGLAAAQNVTLRGDLDPNYTFTSVHINSVGCSGEEKSLSECSHQLVNQRLANTRSLAGVKCAANHSIRLIDGSSPRNGKVQALLEGDDWVTLCHDNQTLTHEDATVMCRQLGFHHSLSSTGVLFSNGEEVATIASNCSGSEFNLQSCEGYAVVSRSCSTNMYINLQCRGAPSTLSQPRVTNLSCSSVTLTWDPPANNSSPITRYTLRHRPIDDTSGYVPWTEQNITGVEGTISGLGGGLLYLVSLGAQNEVGASPFSESRIIVTQSPELFSPLDLVVVTVGATSINISWTVPPTCSVQITSYEVQYFSMVEPETKLTSTLPSDDSALIGRENVVVNYTVTNLSPHLRYSLRVRIYGYQGARGGGYGEGDVRNEQLSHLVISNYSNFISFQTLEDVPSSTPTSFSAFLHSSSYIFQWGAVPDNKSNGVITWYYLSCHFQENGMRRETSYNVSNTTFTYELRDLMMQTQYQCNIAAGTRAGRGPESAPILFTTPAALDVRPGPPHNVAFAIIPHNNDNPRQEILLNARWAIQDCTRDLNCVIVLGYFISCVESNNPSREERKVVWRYELREMADSFVSTTLSVRPFTMYLCSMASFNGYGMGFFGSRISLTTNDLAPSQSPIQIYTTNIRPNMLQLHWTYSEIPLGTLTGFHITTYYQDRRFPDTISGTPAHMEFYRSTTSGGCSALAPNFCYNLMYLLPGTNYTVVIEAATNGGRGPGARINIATTRTAPTITPRNLLSTVTSYEEPYRLRFTWELTQESSVSGFSMVHSGFTIYCSTNETAPNFNTTGRNIIEHSVFISTIESQYNADVFIPTNCRARISSYSCAVAAFNERGAGPKSSYVITYLPCNINNDLLGGSVLANPYFSITFVSLTLLLVISIVICSVLLCLWCKHNKNRDIEEKNYAAVNELYLDESYIRMAPSETNIKPSWQRNNSIAQRTVPPIPSAHSSVNGHLSIDGVNSDNPYDEIPEGRDQHNPYAEINPRLISAASSNTTSDRGFNTPNTRSRTSANMTNVTSVNPQPQNSRHTLDESTATTMTTISKCFESSTLANDTSTITEAINNGPSCTDHLLHPSLSNNTSLSGNDYVEITASGEMRPMTRRVNNNSSNSLTKSPLSLRRSLCSGSELLEESQQSKLNPYEHIPAFKTSDICPSHADSQDPYANIPELMKDIANHSCKGSEVKVTDLCPAHANTEDPYASIPELNAHQSKKDSQKHPSDPKACLKTSEACPKTNEVCPKASDVCPSHADLHDPYANIPELIKNGVSLQKKDARNPYDHISKLQKSFASAHQKATQEDSSESAKAKQSAASSECCRSEFIEFFDHMEERRGSLGSLLSDEPPYVAMTTDDSRT